MIEEATITEIDHGVKPQDVALAKRLQRDPLDYQEEAFVSVKGSIADTWLVTLVGGALTGPIGGFLTTMANVSYRSFEQGNKERRGVKLGEVQAISDESLYYRAERYVYRGGDITQKDLKLKKGDNFYYLRLPVFPDLPPEQSQLVPELYDLIFRDFREKSQGRDYEALVVDLERMDPKHINEDFRQTGRIQRKNLFAGRDIIIHNPDSETVIISREAFESTPFDASDMFEKVISALEQEVGNKISGRLLASELRRLKKIPWEQRLTEAKRLKVKLDNLFNLQAEGLFNGLPNVLVDKQDISNPTKKRSDMHPQLKTVTTIKGTFLEEISYAQGNRRSLVRLDKPLEEVLSLGSKYRPLLLSFALSQMLGSPDILYQITKEPKTKQEITDELGEMVKSSGYLGDPEKIIRRKSRRIGGAVKKALIASLLSSTVFTGIGYLGHVISDSYLNAKYGEESNGDEDRGAGNNTEKQQTPGFQESVPPHHLDWKILSSEGINTPDYWILNTASGYKDGKWILNNDVSNAIKLDKNLYLDESAIAESNNISLSGNMLLESDESSFKIPIRAGTTLKRFHITTIDGEKIDPGRYDVYRLEDGTFEVKINLHDLPTHAISIYELLVPSEDSVHAVKRLSPIDISKLYPEALELLKNSDNTLDGLKNEIQEGKYSINPPGGQEALDKIDGSTESFVNTVASLSAADCDVANSEYALLSSTLATPTYLNVALGYLGTNSSFLDSASAHGFTVSSDGKIYDATPMGGGLENDTLTQQYIESFNGALDADAIFLKQIEDLKQQEARRKELQRDLFKLLGLSALTAGIVIGAKGAQSVRRNLTRENIDATSSRLKAKALILRFNMRELEEAYGFFNWLSWGGDRQFVPNTDIYAAPKNREGLLISMRWGSVQAEKVREYLDNPTEFENIAGIGNAGKIRSLARYLVS